MENNLENQNEEQIKNEEPIDIQESAVVEESKEEIEQPEQSEQPKYEDPNAGYEPEKETIPEPPVKSTGQQYIYGANQSQGQNQTQSNSAQDNYNYNVNTGAAYNPSQEPGMDNSPMSMGDWVLTILVMTLLPCVGIPMYFVWAFGKNGNLNRRNYCRAYLIITGIMLVFAVIICMVIGFSALGSLRYYY